jgi:hypothetical protein
VVGLSDLPLVYSTSDYNPHEDWQYVRLKPRLKAGMRQRLDNLHKLVIARDKDTEGFQPVFTHFPEATAYETRDPVKPYPSKLGSQAHKSRIDDVIVFLNGEKTNPVTSEEEIVAHSEVNAVLVIGAQRVEAALLVELHTNQQQSNKEKLSFIERIWQVVERASRATPPHSRVSKDKILLVNHCKPMLRASNEMVQHSATLALYAEAMNAIYEQDAAHFDTGAALYAKDTRKRSRTLRQ